MGAPFGNLFALGAESGRPPKYKKREEIAAKLAEYLIYIQGEKRTVADEDGDLDEWVRHPEPITITGLCLYLGFESRQSFYDYEKKKEFSYIIKRARLLVENKYEKGLGGKEVAGAIFALKNMGWVDKVETGITDKKGNDVAVPHAPQIMVIAPGTKEYDEFDIKEIEDD
jgi:hypothetical protein